MAERISSPYTCNSWCRGAGARRDLFRRRGLCAICPEFLACTSKLPNGRIRGARVDENRDAGNLSVACAEHEVNHHVVLLAVNALFAGMVKMELG